MKHEQKRVGFSISVSSELLGTNADRGEQKVIDSLAQLWLRSEVRLVEGDHDPPAILYRSSCSSSDFLFLAYALSLCWWPLNSPGYPAITEGRQVLVAVPVELFHCGAGRRQGGVNAKGISSCRANLSHANILAPVGALLRA